MDEPGRQLILEQTRKLHRVRAGDNAFIPGRTPILPSGAVLDEDDRAALVEQALDLHIAAGAAALRFERLFARTLGLRKAHLTNSGSSANLLAVAALCSPQLGDRRLRPGDEVITVAASFPTTVNPILQHGLVPVFVDIDIPTYNTTVDRVAAAIGPHTRAIMMAHALGNPFPVAEIAEIAREHDLYLIEDNCDAVFSTYQGRYTGTFGDLATVSFYPAHHITMGEGGCLLTNRLDLARIAESIRDWGRDCWCEPGEDDRCHKRFDHTMGTLPHGYDHKYIFSEVGYNLKTTDLQAGLGLSQLAKLPDFTATRRRNWRMLRDRLAGLPGLILPEPTPDSDPSWFGFAITVAPQAPFDRREIVRFLESRRIGTRLLFAGNLTRHPAYRHQRYRIADNLHNSNLVAEQTFWIGVYPGITSEMLDYMIESITDFVTERSCGC
ncbi:MAG: lipopolysaccharide biosynthesis protein RfbH [Micromonosporaceae bacterium]|nr:lipopolysaccharide biosynthesis protein RfbH [Micromonosporaceae bacterium]